MSQDEKCPTCGEDRVVATDGKTKHGWQYLCIGCEQKKPITFIRWLRNV
jgi:predicted RNA-binding Zn-ribbon protein involved in translation (DUF1610 family)